jgi:hypothetical protein
VERGTWNIPAATDVTKFNLKRIFGTYERRYNEREEGKRNRKLRVRQQKESKKEKDSIRMQFWLLLSAV